MFVQCVDRYVISFEDLGVTRLVNFLRIKQASSYSVGIVFGNSHPLQILYAVVRFNSIFMVYTQVSLLTLKCIQCNAMTFDVFFYAIQSHAKNPVTININ